MGKLASGVGAVPTCISLWSAHHQRTDLDTGGGGGGRAALQQRQELLYTQHPSPLFFSFLILLVGLTSARRCCCPSMHAQQLVEAWESSLGVGKPTHDNLPMICGLCLLQERGLGAQRAGP